MENSFWIAFSLLAAYLNNLSLCSVNKLNSDIPFSLWHKCHKHFGLDSPIRVPRGLFLHFHPCVQYCKKYILTLLFHEKYKSVDEINGGNVSSLKELTVSSLWKCWQLRPWSMGSINLCLLMHAVNGSQSLDSYNDHVISTCALRLLCCWIISLC